MFTIALSYILGSVPLGFLCRRYNVLHLPVEAVSIFADFLKGLIVVIAVPETVRILSESGLAFVNYPLQNPVQTGAAAIVFAMLGHCLSVYVCGWGGLGVSLVLGGFLVLSPLAALQSLGLLVLSLILLRCIRYASLIGAVSLPFMIFWRYPDDYVNIWAAALTAVMMALTHIRYAAKA